jgi:hypothetical protein
MLRPFLHTGSDQLVRLPSPLLDDLTVAKRTRLFVHPATWQTVLSRTRRGQRRRTSRLEGARRVALRLPSSRVGGCLPLQRNRRLLYPG